MRHLYLLLLLVTLSARATPLEFAHLSFPEGDLRWVDKAGVRTGAVAFAELSGQDRALVTSPQAKILVLNGLSKSGWEIVHVTETGGQSTFLMKRAVQYAAAGPATAPSARETRVPLTLSGGHDTDPRDGGRPVVLIAAALDVPAEVFRETFTHVRPAAGGREPEPEQVRRNKQALLQGLAPHGVTNDRLDAVSNYYRYNGARGQTWRSAPAAGYATVKDGRVISVTVTEAGAGYTSEPVVTVAGLPDVRFEVTLSYGTELGANGSVKSIAVKSDERR